MFFTPLFSYADAKVPSLITTNKNAGGPNGYDKVCQTWTGDDTGTLDCMLPGVIQCAWVVLFETSNGTTEVIDFSPLFDDVIENYLSSGSLSKTFQVGNLRIQSEIQDYYGNLEGVIRFYVYEV